MDSEEPGRPRLTAKGQRTRARIVAAAARLIYERGVASTTLDDVKAAAAVSGSQMYHYFPDKDELVQAVIGYQADVIAGRQRQADLGNAEGLRAWRDMVIAQASREEGKGGCPLGSLAGQLAETEPLARALLADGFGQWQAVIGEGLRRLYQAGELPDGTDTDALAVTLLAALQGGLLLAQVQRDPRPLETAIDTLLQLARNGRPDIPAGHEISLADRRAAAVARYASRPRASHAGVSSRPPLFPTRCRSVVSTCDRAPGPTCFSHCSRSVSKISSPSRSIASPWAVTYRRIRRLSAGSGSRAT
jgi:TetR/AcrR family transcriptional repressor of nem operon